MLLASGAFDQVAQLGPLCRRRDERVADRHLQLFSSSSRVFHHVLHRNQQTIVWPGTSIFAEVVDY